MGSRGQGLLRRWQGKGMPTQGPAQLPGLGRVAVGRPLQPGQRIQPPRRVRVRVRGRKTGGTMILICEYEREYGPQSSCFR